MNLYIDIKTPYHVRKGGKRQVVLARYDHEGLFVGFVVRRSAAERRRIASYYGGAKVGVHPFEKVISCEFLEEPHYDAISLWLNTVGYREWARTLKANWLNDLLTSPPNHMTGESVNIIRRVLEERGA